MADSQSGRRISFSTVWQAVLFPIENAMALIRLGLLPVLIAVAILYAATLIAPWIGGQLLRMLSLLLYVIVVSVVAVGIHRLILRGEQPEWTLPRPRTYEIAYGAAVLAIMAAIFAGQGVIQSVAVNAAAQWPFRPLDNLIGTIWPRFSLQFIFLKQSPGLNATMFLLAGLLAWPALRLALAFPHAAVTGQLSFGESWEATRGNVWRLIGVNVVLAIIVYVLSLGLGVLVLAVMALKSHLGLIIISLLALLLTGVQFSMFVALMSYIYRELIQGAEPAPLLADLPPPLRPEPGT